MKDKYLNEDFTEEDLDSSTKYNSLNSHNNDLFDDNAYIPHLLISVKKIKLPKNEFNWEILENGRRTLEIKGVKLSKKEKTFLNTSEGFLFLMSEYKNGSKTLPKIKEKLREKIND